MAKKTSGVLVAALATMLSVGAAEAAQCGSTGAGFDAWKRAFAGEAKAEGIGPAAHFGADALQLLDGDDPGRPRPEELPSFPAGLHGETRSRHHRGPRQEHETCQCRALCLDPAALWGAAGADHRHLGDGNPLGNTTGSQNTVSAVATLAYDCRRPAYFRVT